jgi:hypothetical protein
VEGVESEREEREMVQSHLCDLLKKAAVFVSFLSGSVKNAGLK